MLGKLLKHELFATGKVLLPINLLLFCATLLGKLLISLSIFPKNESSTVVSILLLALLTIYILILIALAIITTVYIVVHYYKSMFSREGYLTLTLPVSQSSLLNTKTLISSFWFFITTSNTILSVFVLISAVVKKADTSVTYAMINKNLFQIFGIHLNSMILFFFIIIIVSSIYSTLFIFTCINIGQLFTKHRIIAAVLSYVIISFVLQIISFIFSFSGQFAFIYGNPESAKSMAKYLETILFGSCGMYVVLSIIFYLISTYILRKKINIE